MTRAQIEAEVRAIGRTCRGPRDPDARRVVGGLTRRFHLLAPVAAATLGAAVTPGQPSTTDALLTALFARDRKDVAAAVDEAARQGCGFDVNELILQHPLDGQPKSAPCPGCGTVLRWTPARYEEPAGG